MKRLFVGAFIALLSTGLISCETEHLEPVPTDANLVSILEESMCAAQQQDSKLVMELEDNMRAQDQEGKQEKTRQKGTGN